MNRKHYLTIKARSMAVLTAALSSGLLGLVSCADGFDSNETWKSDVSNTQLESPALTEDNLSVVVNSDGSESVKVSWPAVTGAGGYECVAVIVDDPANPDTIYNTIGDRNTFSFDRKDDTKYQISVRTLGNEELNNTGAETASTCSYSTLVPGQTIPAGSDIAEFVASHLLDIDTEQAFELEAGATYTINSEINFGKKQVTFRGDKVNRPTVIMDGDGFISTAGGLKVKFINFDCSTLTSKGVIQGSSTQFPELKSDNFEYALAGKCYILENPIIIQECMFKEVPMCLFYSGVNAWAFEDFRISDCIVQLNNDGTKFGDAAVICTYSSTSKYEGGTQWNSTVRNVTIRNSTIYNIKKNSKNRMIRFLSNKMGRIYTTQTGSATIENCTFSQTFTGKEFANNTPNDRAYTITFNNNVCYDCWRLGKFIQSNNTRNINIASNIIRGVTNTVFGEDKDRCATEEANLEFEGDVLQVLDLTQENGGVNFKIKSGSTTTDASTLGDPRWRE